MGSVSVNPPKTPVTKGTKGIAAATLPNVCKMPGPPAPFVPTPLPNIGNSGDSPKGYSKSVKIEGQAVAIRGASFGSKGDMASKGTGGGLFSSNTHGPTKFIGPGSFNVEIQGKNVHLLGDPMLNNCGPGGGPANAATMSGVMQAPDVMVVLYGDDEPCSMCGEKHPLEATKPVIELINTVFWTLNQKIDAQRSKIVELSQLNARLNPLQIRQAQLQHKEANKHITGQGLTPKDRAELPELAASIPALEVQVQALEAYFLADAVLRWEAKNRTYSKGYMVGVGVCVCTGKKLIACSSNAPPGFARVAGSSGFTLVSAPVVAHADAVAPEEPWNCAAKQIVQNLKGHRPKELLERLFLPAIAGLKATKGPSIQFRLTGLDGVVRPETRRFNDGEDTPSCAQCQQQLPAMYCRNKC